jgi:IS4 transposase
MAGGLNVALDKVVERFIEGSPVTVMARLGLERALEPQWLDALFEQHSERQYTRELLFSTTVDLMSLVAVGLRPSLHAAAKAAVAEGALPVSITALYDKVNRTEPAVIRALVAGSAQRLGPVLGALAAQPQVTVPGFRLRILDGNHLAASEKRLKPLRGFAGAALPGQSLVVYDPDLGMVTDLIAGEDGHTQERALMGPLLAAAGPGELWLADRNFCTRAILSGWQQRGSCFLVREHAANPNPRPLGQPKKIGRVDTGTVYEQAVAIDDAAGAEIILRRIELQLAVPTEDGDTVIRLLSNVPAAKLTACELARLYRKRWRIESMFQRLEAVLHSEIPTLGQPRAALFAFGVAILAYNVLALISRAITIQHQLDPSKIQISPFYLATEIKATYRGMMLATDAPTWQRYDEMDAHELAQMLLRIAAHANPRALRSHPRGPKLRATKKYVSRGEAQRHVATARVLKDGKIK